MATIVISYSYTANNDLLASHLSRKLGARQIRLTEPKPRTMGTIALDMLFQRTPPAQADLTNVGTGDFVVFVGPVWMGRAASPLRHTFRTLRSRVKSYAFLSVCGGAGPNPRLETDLTKRMGKEPAYLKELPIVSLLPHEPKPTRQMTSSYHITDQEAQAMTETVLPALRKERVRLS